MSVIILQLYVCGMPPLVANESDNGVIELSFVETPVSQAFEMLSTLGEISIILMPDISGKVTAHLYEKSIDNAIRTIANAAGYAVEKNADAYIVMNRDEVGKDSLGDMTSVRSYKVQYVDPGKAVTLLEKYLSRYGSISVLQDRKLIVVADRPDFLNRIEQILSEIDIKPQQILIKAEILEITLNEDEIYGIDWSSKNNKTTLGTNGLSTLGSTGFFMDYLTDDLDIFLKALSEDNRVRTLSTPKLLVLEDQNAEVIIGDRIGFKVTTTIDSVTSESVEFIESGVILRVKASVDNDDRIMLDVHPEVSSGSITDGIPSVSTTEVTTHLIAGNGQPVFIGGLIKNTKLERETGVPGLRSIPLLGALFSQTEERYTKTETIVVIRPFIISDDKENVATQEVERSQTLADNLQREVLTQATKQDLNNALRWRDNSMPSENSKTTEIEDFATQHTQVEHSDSKDGKQKKHSATEGLGWFFSVLAIIAIL